MDVGGGLAVPYHADDQDADVDDYAAIVLAAARETGLTVLLEPGRVLVALVTSSKMSRSLVNTAVV